MTSIILELLILLLLVLANGFFAMAEMAIVSSRKARLQQHAEKGNEGASAALELVSQPNDFLSTVQIGITLVGVLAGAFGGATIAGEMAAGLGQIQFLAPYSEAISVAVVVMTITYFTLVLGELAPKRLALNNAERIASRIAPFMRRLSRLVSPIAHFLSKSSQAILRLVGAQHSAAPPVTEEEIRIMIEEGTESGVFEPVEEEIVDHVFRLGDRKVSSLLTPRTEIIWIDINDSAVSIQQKITTSGHSRFPVAEGSLDKVLGVVLAKDLLAQSLCDQVIDLGAIIRPVPFVPESMPALDVLSRFKEYHAKIALVLDEFSGLQGLVTSEDLLEALVGDIPGLEGAEPEALLRADGSWLMDGLLPLDEFQKILDLEEVAVSGVETLGGLVMSTLGRIPAAGDMVHWQGTRLEVMDMDGHRVDKVMASHSTVDSDPSADNIPHE